MNGHNPVPFDFVPFSEKAPITKTPEHWEKLGSLFSGHIRYTMKVLTPVHLVGQQTRQGGPGSYRITKSFFNRCGATPTMPGTGIKGMIRSFFEALTNSWVGQVTDIYPVNPKERWLGYSVTSEKKPADKIFYGPVIPERLHPAPENGMLDAASFLFGIVGDNNKESVALSSRVVFEDIVIDSGSLSNKIVQLPDIPGKAFMGGPKPRINNWWYFQPAGIADRRIGNRHIAQFIGDEYRGRKFYFHQLPQNAIAWYDNPSNWPHTTTRGGTTYDNYYKYPVESLVEKAEITGRILFERVPEPLLKLLILTLCPGKNIRHKIGYGQAFGMGSVEIVPEEVHTFTPHGIFLNQETYPFEPIIKNGFSNSKENALDFVDQQALSWLAKILSFDSIVHRQDYVLTYPPFKDGYFKTPVPMERVRAIQNQHKNYTTDTIALGLFNFKKTIDFRIYQKKAPLWSAIDARTP